MQTTLEYLELLRDALAKRAADATAVSLLVALTDAQDAAQELIDALKTLETAQ